MAAATFSPFTLNSDGWTEIADAASHSAVTLDAGNVAFGVQICLAGSAPDDEDDDFDDYFVLRARDALMAIALPAGTKVYARASNGSEKLRGYRVAAS